MFTVGGGVCTNEELVCCLKRLAWKPRNGGQSRREKETDRELMAGWTCLGAAQRLNLINLSSHDKTVSRLWELSSRLRDSDKSLNHNILDQVV